MAKIIFLILSGIAGLIFGSFFNCVINADRRGFMAPLAPSRRNAGIWFRRSICPKCGHELGVWDLIPIFSFIFLRGRCRYCKQAISWQYPIIEIITAALFIFVAWYYLIFNSQFSIINQFSIFNFLILIRGLFFVSVLLLIFVFDLKYQIIPDRISIPALFIAVIFGVFLTLSTVNSRGALIKLFLAILIGAGFFFAQYLLSKGKWIGGGDICLGALMGAMLSWPNILVALFLAYITGAIYGIVAIIFKKKTLKSAVPFGTFLTAATFITLFYGTKILDWYLNFIV